jgi:hypothetical protein
MKVIKGMATVRQLLSQLPLVFSALALMISFLSFKLTDVRSVKPVLIIEYRGAPGWYSKNVGNGPALNIVVAERERNEWFKPVRVPPLANGESRLLRWLDQTNVSSIGVTYVDIDDRRYTSVTSKDLTTIEDGNRLTKWREDDIQKQWELESDQR